MGERQSIAHKRVFARLAPEKPQLETAKLLQKPLFALPDCQPISVNTVLCDALGVPSTPKSCIGSIPIR